MAYYQFRVCKYCSVDNLNQSYKDVPVKDYIIFAKINLLARLILLRSASNGFYFDNLLVTSLALRKSR